MGRVLKEKRTIIGTSARTNSIGYSYYKDGELKVLTYPNSNRQVTYTVNGSGGYTAGRPLKAVDTTNNINFATEANYTPHRALASVNDWRVGGFSGDLLIDPAPAHRVVHSPRPL